MIKITSLVITLLLMMGNLVKATEIVIDKHPYKLSQSAVLQYLGDNKYLIISQQDANQKLEVLETSSKFSPISKEVIVFDQEGNLKNTFYYAQKDQKIPRQYFGLIYNLKIGQGDSIRFIAEEKDGMKFITEFSKMMYFTKATLDSKLKAKELYEKRINNSSRVNRIFEVSNSKEVNKFIKLGSDDNYKLNNKKFQEELNLYGEASNFSN